MTDRILSYAGYWIVAACVVFAVVVPLTALPADFALQPSLRFQPPSAEAWFGRDSLGRNLAVLIAEGMQTSMMIAVAVVLGSCVLGWALGAFSGFVGGRTDSFIGRFIDLFNAFPGLILGIALVTVLGASIENIILVLILTTWVNFARIVRARVLEIKSQEYIAASRMYGATVPYILVRHVWPNTSGLVLSLCLVLLPNVMLAEANITFLGFGLQPPSISLGFIIGSQKDYLQISPAPVLYAGGALVLVCAGIAMCALDIRRRVQET